ncbi:MAG: glycosyltransferase family 2 protein [Betaproteobacteria bacterium]
MSGPLRVAVVVPSYRVSRQILGVLAAIPEDVAQIYVIDDLCPEATGHVVEAATTDRRVRVLRHVENLGVGGAVVTGYRQAIADGMDIIVKLDGDGQMDPALIPHLVKPIVEGRADYTKGNRFYSFDLLRTMPAVRLVGNAALSLINKIASGYWSIMDPTNGYTAIHTKLLQLLPLGVIEPRYFFESDMLYHVGLVRACVIDVPMRSLYAGETSSLSIRNVLLRFPGKYAIRTLKRFAYSYLLRDFNAGSVETILGGALLLFGVVFGAIRWTTGFVNAEMASSGTVMLAALPVILGVQLLLSALYYDIQNQPRDALHPLL